MEKPDVSPVQWPAKTVNRKQRYIDVTSKFRIGHAAAKMEVNAGTGLGRKSNWREMTVRYDFVCPFAFLDPSPAISLLLPMFLWNRSHRPCRICRPAT